MGSTWVRSWLCLAERQVSKGEDWEEDGFRCDPTSCGLGWGWGGLGSRLISFFPLSLSSPSSTLCLLYSFEVEFTYHTLHLCTFNDL